MANAFGARSSWLLLSALALGGCASAQSGESPNTPPEPGVTQPRQPTEVQPAADPTVLADLKDSGKVEQVVLSLITDFDSVAANGTKTEEALTFVASYAEPLSEAFVNQHATLSPKTRGALINLLVSFDDPRTVPAHAKALRVYAETGGGVDDAIWACQAAKKLKDERLQKALLSAFGKIDMSDKHGRRLGAHLQTAMLANPSSGWSTILITHLSAPIKRPESFNDKPAVKSFQNERFWQTSAAMLLGDLADPSAVKPLFSALLDRTKRDVHPHAELALLKHGAPAVELAERLLFADDSELVALSKASEPDLAEPHVFHAADFLAKLAPESSRAKLEQAWQSTRDPVSRVLIAVALAKLPKAASSLEIWQKTTLRTGLKTTLPRGESALEVLAEGAPYWFEPDLVPWLNQRVKSAPGKGSRKGDLQRALVIAMSHLVTDPHLKASNRVSQKFGGRTGTPAFEAAEAQVKRCGEDPACYLEQVDPKALAPEAVLASTKAAVMVGVFGRASHRDGLLGKLGKVKDRRLQESVVRVVEKMSPAADERLLSELKKLSAPPAGSVQSIQADTVTPITLGFLRLQAR